jgi:hypothetical protein
VPWSLIVACSSSGRTRRRRFDLMLNKIFAVARQVEKAERAASAEED